MRAPVALGVIGCGRVTREWHVPALRGLSDALAAGLLRAPAAVSPEAVAAARQRHDLGTHVDALRRVLASID